MNGAALPAVLFAMAMTSSLAVGGVYVTRQLIAAGGQARQADVVEPAVERALIEATVRWDSTAREHQPVGFVDSLPRVIEDGIRVQVWVTRASQTLYWLVAEATTGVRPRIRRRIGVLVRVENGRATLVPQRAWSELP